MDSKYSWLVGVCACIGLHPAAWADDPTTPAPPPAPAPIVAPAPTADPEPTPSAPASAGSIFKCKDGDGNAIYSDKPCGAAADMQQIEIAPTPLPDIVDAQPLCASEDGARLDIAGLDGGVLAGLSPGQRAGVKEALAEHARWGARAGGRWGRGAKGEVHVCAYTPAGEIVEFIATSDAKLIQVRGGVISYRNDPETPAALLERCADTYRQCLAGADVTADSCVAQIPTCAATEPWKGGRNCCPLACKNVYERKRKRGESGDAAFLGALYEPPGCIEGQPR